MNKFVMSFIGIIVLALSVGVIAMTSMLYDKTNELSTDVYFFQTNDFAQDRVNMPVPIEQLANYKSIADDKILDLLISKFLREYFYVVPYSDNIKTRENSNSVLDKMSGVGSNVFEQWQKEELPSIQKMTDNKIYRTIKLINKTKPMDSDYWKVTYQTQTWLHPNKILVPPIIENNVIYLEIAFEPGIRETLQNETFNIEKMLKRGYDPSVMFKFKVTQVMKE